MSGTTRPELRELVDRAKRSDEKLRGFNHAMRLVESGNLPIGYWLRFMREEQGKTLRAFAREIGVSAPYWSDVEHCRAIPTPERYEAIAAALGGRSASVVRHVARHMPCSKCGRTGP